MMFILTFGNVFVPGVAVGTAVDTLWMADGLYWLHLPALTLEKVKML